MASEARSCSIRLIERLFAEGVVAGLSDAELVDRFAKARDPEAFAALVAKHGPMVMAVCRGLLRSSGDADDAFQATFLIFLNRAGTFAVGASLGGWLYQVARRVARQVRQADARRRRRELAACSRAEATLDCPSERSEIIRVIHDEIDRLPERYRSPILLCDLQGLTRDEAAGLLGWPAGTVGGRLARARQQLRDRLERRGFAPSITLPILSHPASPAGAWRSSLEAAVRNTSSLVVGTSATPGAIGLAARAGRGTIGASIKVAVVAALAAIVTAGLVAARGTPKPQTPPAAASTPASNGLVAARGTPKPQTPPAAASTPASNPAPAPDPEDPKLAGHFVGRVVGPDGQPVGGARLFITPNEPSPTQPGPVRASSGADGRFEFDAPDMTVTDLDGLPSRRQGLLIATADHYQPDWMVTWGRPRSGSIRSHFDPVKGADVTLQLARDDVPIHGRLLDPQGRPLAGARVRLSALKVPWKRDLDAHLRKFESQKDNVRSFDYERSTYSPVVLRGVATEAIADADGRFRLSGLGRDRLADMWVTAPSVFDTPLTVMTRDADDVVIARDSGGYPYRAILGAGFTLQLQAGRTVSGLVRDRETHQPIPGMWVGSSLQHRLKHEFGYQPARSDANGRFTISGIHPAYLETAEFTALAPPGQPYLLAQGVAQPDLLLECVRGVPFRLKVVDEAGMPVSAEVEYRAVMPNPHLTGLLHGTRFDYMFPVSRAAMPSKGIFEGFALPGPGAVLVKLPNPGDYRAANVDPKAFFAPGKTDWTPLELVSDYGSEDSLIVGIGGSGLYQHDYAAIVLVNPPVASKPLELSAIIVRDKPRHVTILDPEGKPVVGVQTQGLAPFQWGNEPPLRASTVPIRQLRPDRGRRITFLKEDRKLIGFLPARGDGDTPYTVRLEPWATVTGRILDENGNPFAAKGAPGKAEKPSVVLGMDARLKIATHDDPHIGVFPDSACDSNGRFRVERLVPGQRYTAVISRDAGWFAGKAFEKLVLRPGEIRDLGDIRSKTPVEVRDK